MRVKEPVQAEAFSLKGRLLTLTVMTLRQTTIDGFLAQLKAVVAQAPKLFLHAPIVLDCSELKGVSFDVKAFCDLLREVKMCPVAIQGASVIQQKAAIACGLSVITASAKNDITKFDKTHSMPRVEKPTEEKPSEKSPEITQKISQASTSSKPTLVIDKPIRSGQQIYARDSDLIVMSSVSCGAEVIADGNIHIYGVLRGRALAGASGRQDAHIFCSALDAELVSIQGHFRLSDALKTYSDGKPKHITLSDAGHLLIEDLV